MKKTNYKKLENILEEYGNRGDFKFADILSKVVIAEAINNLAIEVSELKNAYYRVHLGNQDI